MTDSTDSQEHHLSNRELEEQRLEKLRELREKGIDPYPSRFERSEKILTILTEKFKNNEPSPEARVSTAGRVRSKRPMGKAGFLQIEDESGRIQVYANNKTLDEDDYFVFHQVDIGDIIGVEAECFITKTGEFSLRASKLKILSKNLAPLPVVKEKDGKVFDAFSKSITIYRKRNLDLVVNPGVRKTFQIRSRMINELREFLTQKGFIEVETPMMQAIASGAAAKPFKTYHNALDMNLFLRIAPELYLKRLIVGGFEKVFEINRNFRNEGISTKHNPEFTMMELYQAYADFSDMMKITEEMVVHLADSVLETRQLPYGKEIISLEPPWERLPYLQSIKDRTGLDFSVFLKESEPSLEKAREMAGSIGVDGKHCNTFWEVVDEIFSDKVEPTLIQPVFITEFPKAISPLAKEMPGNPLLVERFEPYIVAREMGNAFSELNDPIEQKIRFEQQGAMKEQGAAETIEMDSDFIEALKVGMPPTGGLGIGIDRLVMLFTNSASIKDVILFPLLKKKV